VKSSRSGRTAHVADKDEAARTGRPDRAFEHTQKISDTWKILHDRIKNHGVERVWLDVSKVVGTSLKQHDFAVDPPRAANCCRT
jgi:hypothetical protein